ncbi:MAG: hypothetical protein ABSC64_20725, partial [Candidatus Korobacteraceae bacterium]
SRSPLVIRQILAIGEDLKRGIRSIKEIVVFDEEGITEETLLPLIWALRIRFSAARYSFLRRSSWSTVPVM